MHSRVRIKVSGDLACWTRPDMKVERASYEVITPSAARGILDAIMWRPEMRWVIHSIEVLKPIQWMGFRRNEIQSKIAPRTVAGWMKDPSSYTPQPAGAGSQDATPRYTLALRDVEYLIEAEPIVFNTAGDNSPQKYAAMLMRRVEKGQHHHMPALGMREFAAEVSLPSGAERPINESRALGTMLYDIIFRQPAERNEAVFFSAQLVDGRVETSPVSVIPDHQLREALLTCSYKR